MFGLMRYAEVFHSLGLYSHVKSQKKKQSFFISSPSLKIHYLFYSIYTQNTFGNADLYCMQNVSYTEYMNLVMT